MALTEHKTKTHHYFTDKKGRKQGEFKRSHDNGQPKGHYFYVDDKRVIDFLKSPELYPKTPEDKTYFALKHGRGKFLDNPTPNELI